MDKMDFGPQGQQMHQLKAQSSVGPIISSTASSSTNSMATTQSPQQSGASGNKTPLLCAVCGEENAKMHYGVLACLGCKGFFRRALKKVNEYECLRENKCLIDKQERNSCRSCRLQKCLDMGMDPSAVRPDRDFTGKQMLVAGGRRHSSAPFSAGSRQQQQQRNCTAAAAGSGQSCRRRPIVDDGKHWCQRLPVEMRTMLMTLQNIEAQVVHGDTAKNASEIYPLHINTIREIIEEPTKLCGRRTEMRYEPYRMARNEELSVIVYRRMIAAVDWVELLAEKMGGLSTEDRIALVKTCFSPLTLFKCSARTSAVTDNENMLCLCNFAYVPREISKAYNDAYHLDNGLVERLLNELVTPFRRIHLAEEEVVCVSAIIVLNPMAKDLTEAAVEKVFQLRNRVSATLYQIIRERRPECNANATFGNLLLYLPIIASLANAMSENLRFAQTFSTLGGIPLLTSLFGCFPVEPLIHSELFFPSSSAVETPEMQKCQLNVEAKIKLQKKRSKNESGKGSSSRRRHSQHIGTQTEWTNSQLLMSRKRRRLCPTASLDESNQFHLLKAPCTYTLAEMFDDLNELQEEEEERECANQRPSTSAQGCAQQQRRESQQQHQRQHQQDSTVCSSFLPVHEVRQRSSSWTPLAAVNTSNNPNGGGGGGNQEQMFLPVVHKSQQQMAFSPAALQMMQQQQRPSHSLSQWTLTTAVPPPPTSQIQQLYLSDLQQQKTVQAQSNATFSYSEDQQMCSSYPSAFQPMQTMQNFQQQQGHQLNPNIIQYSNSLDPPLFVNPNNNDFSHHQAPSCNTNFYNSKTM